MGKKGTFNALLSLLGYIVRTPILPSHSLEPTLKSSPSSLSLISAPFCPCRARAAGSWWWSGSTISPAKWSSPRAGMPLSGRPPSWLLCATSMSVFSCSLPQVDWPASPAMEGRYSDAHQHQLHVDTYAFALLYSFHVLTSDRALFSLSLSLIKGGGYLSPLSRSSRHITRRVHFGSHLDPLDYIDFGWFNAKVGLFLDWPSPSSSPEFAGAVKS